MNILHITPVSHILHYPGNQSQPTAVSPSNNTTFQFSTVLCLPVCLTTAGVLIDFPLGRFLKTLWKGREHCGTNSNKYVESPVHEHHPYLWQSGEHLLPLDGISFVGARDAWSWETAQRLKYLPQKQANWNPDPYKPGENDVWAWRLAWTPGLRWRRDDPWGKL